MQNYIQLYELLDFAFALANRKDLNFVLAFAVAKFWISLFTIKLVIKTIIRFHSCLQCTTKTWSTNPTKFTLSQVRTLKGSTIQDLLTIHSFSGFNLNKFILSQDSTFPSSYLEAFYDPRSRSLKSIFFVLGVKLEKTARASEYFRLRPSVEPSLSFDPTTLKNEPDWAVVFRR